MKPFAVRADSFNLLEAFKKDCEAMGWQYCSSFNKFKDSERTYLLFSEFFCQYPGSLKSYKPQFSLTSYLEPEDCLVYELATHYVSALTCAKAVLKLELGKSFYGLKPGEYFTSISDTGNLWLGIVGKEGKPLVTYCPSENIFSFDGSFDEKFSGDVEKAKSGDKAELNRQLSYKGLFFQLDKLDLHPLEIPPKEGDLTLFFEKGEDYEVYIGFFKEKRKIIFVDESGSLWHGAVKLFGVEQYRKLCELYK